MFKELQDLVTSFICLRSVDPELADLFNPRGDKQDDYLLGKMMGLISERTLEQEVMSRPVAVSGPEHQKGSCAKCGCEGARLKCARCLSARYCSAECQRSHYSEHKIECKRIAQQRAD